MKEKSLQPRWWQHSRIAWLQLQKTLSDLTGFRDHASELSITDECTFLNQENWCKVVGGATNINYRLRLPTQSLLIQVINPDNLPQLPGEDFCAINQILSEQYFLNNWLKKCWFESENIRIFDWVEMPTAKVELFQQKGFVEALSVFLVQLHNSHADLPVLDIHEHLQRYYHNALKKSHHSKNELQRLLDKALLLAQHFSATNLCHNDLSPGNLLFKDKLVVIDWEYATIGDPLFDLAGLSINFQLNMRQEKNLILNYSEKSRVNFNFEKFNKMKQLYPIVEQLWSYANNPNN
ncbi:phosphotransferase [Aliikangiella sp. IMCC44359]|uniref:phosphotransferase n=1 Tax=Aliikangiella sp. IMCC44359 TaxID=3459125 RepID=UPI00403ABD19